MFVRAITCDEEFCDILVPQDVMPVESQLAVLHSYLGGVELHYQREQRDHDQTDTRINAITTRNLFYKGQMEF